MQPQDSKTDATKAYKSPKTAPRIQDCNRVAPKNKAYCASNCEGYCVQPDRRDGLSGSVDASGAEVGWLSAYDLPARATGTPRAVPYGEDRPPGLPDVFGINDKLRA